VLQKDYYQMLGLNQNASEDEIKRAYRKLALRYHPDHHPDDPESEEKFKEISEAYAVLSHPEKRMEYDRFGHNGFRRRYTREDVFKDFNFEKIFREFGFESEKFIFHEFFCGKRGRGRGCGRRRAKFTRMGFFDEYIHDSFFREEIDQICEIPLTASEAFYGTQKEIIVDTGLSQKRYSIQIPPGVGPNSLLSLFLDELGGKKIQFRVRII
jgi:curved DNA-binding protein